MKFFCPTDEEQREALLEGRFDGAELYGQERIAWDDAGVDEDALWVAAEVDATWREGMRTPTGSTWAIGRSPCPATW